MFRRKRQDDAGALPLNDAVRAMSDCPCPEHEKGFVAALGAADELLLRVMGPAGPGPDEDLTYVAGPDEQINVATAVAPNGRSFLHAFTDLEAARGKYPEGSFVGVAPQAAFRMCLSNGNEGLLVTAAGADDPWAALTADGVVRLIKT